ncbi:MAG: hypothetical protein IT459_03540, partial [Planctomycetes bacterium]|nr:hypothetical protein [Planctomycetota bacterium]
YYCQNWRADVVAIVSGAAIQKEQVRYSAYGVPFGLPAGDADSDGDCDAADGTIVTAWKVAPTYDVRGDIDLDGDVDATDESAVAGLSGTTSGRTSGSAVGNTTGFSGSHAAAPASFGWIVRNRALLSGLGQWTQRDELQEGDAYSIYCYCGSRPVSRIDPLGWSSQAVGQSAGTPSSPPQDACADACKAFQDSNGSGGTAPTPGTTMCAANGSTCACTGTDQQISDWAEAEMPDAADDYGSPGADSVALMKTCAQTHENAHLKDFSCADNQNPNPPPCELMVPAAEYYESECKAKAAGIECAQKQKCLSASCVAWRKAFICRNCEKMKSKPLNCKTLPKACKWCKKKTTSGG